MSRFSVVALGHQLLFASPVICRLAASARKADCARASEALWALAAAHAALAELAGLPSPGPGRRWLPRTVQDHRAGAERAFASALVRLADMVDAVPAHDAARRLRDGAAVRVRALLLTAMTGL